MNEMTKAQQLVEVAKWIKIQNPEFQKHFKTMRAIIKLYLRLPKDYDKKKSLTAYVNNGMKSKDYTAKLHAKEVALITNTIFGFRYFKDAPFKYTITLGLSHGTRRNGEEFYEVWDKTRDNCSIYNEFAPSDFGLCSITVKTIGDVKRAAEKLLEGGAKKKGEDYEVIYTQKLQDAMKLAAPTTEVLQEQCSIPGL